MWIPILKKGDPEAAQQLFNRYFERLIAHVKPKINRSKRRVSDEDDIVAQAFFELFNRAEQGKFPRLFDRHDLWALLLTIADRRVINEYRNATALVRGGPEGVRGDSVFVRKEDGGRNGGFEQIPSPDPTPEFCEIMRESFDSLLAQLSEEDRQVALLKLKSHTNPEIAKIVKCSLATVERRLKRIREIWSVEETQPDESNA